MKKALAYILIFCLLCGSSCLGEEPAEPQPEVVPAAAENVPEEASENNTEPSGDGPETVPASETPTPEEPQAPAETPAEPEPQPEPETEGTPEGENETETENEPETPDEPEDIGESEEENTPETADEPEADDVPSDPEEPADGTEPEGRETTETTEDAESSAWENAWKDEAWYYAADGSVVSGKLDDIYKALAEGGKPAQKYQPVLCSEKVLIVTKVPRGSVSWFEFMYDDRVITADANNVITVNVSETDPEIAVTEPAGDLDELIDLYVFITHEAKPVQENSGEAATEETASTDGTAQTTDDTTAQEYDCQYGTAESGAPENDPDNTDPDEQDPDAEDPDDADSDEQDPDGDNADPDEQDPDGDYAGPGYTPEPRPEAELTYTVTGYTEGAWSTEAPVFELNGIPEGTQYWEYAVVPYGKRLVVLPDGTYSAADEGTYTLRLVILDDMGDVVTATELIDIMNDFTEPEITYVNTDTGVSYQVQIYAQDSLSGLDAVSFDSGETWTPFDESGCCTYTADKACTLPAGTVLARDLAGNVTTWDEDIKLTKYSSGGYGGGGTYKPHSSGDGVVTPDYDEVDVKTEEAAMHVLTFDGEQLEVELNLNSASGFTIPEDYAPVFTAETYAWPVYAIDPETGSLTIATPEVTDSLVLKAQPDEAVTGDYEYVWNVGGAALRQLKKSGIQYLTLEADGYLVTLPTDGFLEGETYTALKMAGTSTRRFSYQVILRHVTQADGTVKNEFEIKVSVNDVTTTLTTDPTLGLYMVNVYDGPAEMLSIPYGPWADDEEAEEELQ